MSKDYNFLIKVEGARSVVTVYAPTREQALEIVENLYNTYNIVWEPDDYPDFENLDVEEIT